MDEVVAAGDAELRGSSGIELDYFGVAHARTLAPLANWDGLNEAVVLVAAQVGPVRLIDNMTIRRH